MRSFKLTLASLALLLASCAPAAAQGASEAQYTSEFCPTDPSGPNTMQVQSVCDAPPAAADNVGQGTSAVNEALAEPGSSPGAPALGAASSTSVPASSATASPPAESASAGANMESSEDSVSASFGADGSGTGSVAAGDPESANTARSEGLVSISELPETGGAPPFALGTGALLIALGLTIRRIVR